MLEGINTVLLPNTLPAFPAHLSKSPWLLNNYGHWFRMQFQKNGRVENLDYAILAYERAIELASVEHQAYARYFENCGQALVARFNVSGNLADIGRGISMFERSVRSTSAIDVDLNLPRRLHDLAMSFFYRFDWTGDLSDSDNAIFNLQRAVELTPQSHADMPACLNNLGIMFTSRFRRTGDVANIENAQSNFQLAIELTPQGDTNMPSRLHNLANAFTCRFRLTNDLATVDSAIFNLQRALELTPQGHADLGRWLGTLGSTFGSRFDHTSNLADFESAKLHLQRAIELTPQGHADMPVWLNNLGDIFASGFRLTGDLADIENAIFNLQKAVDLTPQGHADMSPWLDNLGLAFQNRFEHTGDLANIESAIRTIQRAVQLGPQDHSDMLKWLNDLGNAFHAHSSRTGDVASLENALFNLQRAIELIPQGHKSMCSALNNLGNVYATRFSLTGDLASIENAISVLQLAIDLTPQGHTDLPPRVHNLGFAFRTRFDRTGDIAHIENAISHYQRAIELTPPEGHAVIPGWLHNLGIAWYKLFQHTQNREHLSQAISAHRLSATHVAGTPYLRFVVAGNWARLSYLTIHVTPHTDQTMYADSLKAFRTALECIHQYMGLQQTVHKRFTQLRDISDFIMPAVSMALFAGENDTALEWLEHGRCLVWNQIQQLRTPVEELRSHNPSLAAHFLHVANALDTLGSRQVRSTIFGEEPMKQMIATQGENIKHVEFGLKEWPRLLEQIRAIPNFSRFLLPSTTSSLLTGLPRDGAVVIFNIHHTRCDAFALRSGFDTPLHIRLDRFSDQQAVKLRDTLRNYLIKAHVRMRESESEAERGMVRVQLEPIDILPIYDVLRELWEHVTQPILDALGYMKVVCLHSPSLTLFPLMMFLFSQTRHAGLVSGGVLQVPLFSFQSMLPGFILRKSPMLVPVFQTTSFPLTLQQSARLSRRSN